MPEQDSDLDAAVGPYLYKYRSDSSDNIISAIFNKTYYPNPIQFNDPLDTRPLLSLGKLDDIERIRKDTIIANGLICEYFRTANMPTLHTDFSKKFSQSIQNGDFEQISVHYRAALTEINARKRIFCLSRKWDDFLMWSHYANGHRGFCIRYDRPEGLGEDKIINILYENNNFSLSEVVRLIIEKSVGHVANLMARTKHANWAYEQETRIIENDTKPSEWPFLRQSAIYFGLECSKETKSLIMNAIHPRNLTNSKNRNAINGSKTTEFYQIELDSKSTLQAKTIQDYPDIEELSNAKNIEVQSYFDQYEPNQQPE